MHKSRTRKQLQCVFGNVDRQSKLTCSFKVENECLLYSRQVIWYVRVKRLYARGQKNERSGVSESNYNACFESQLISHGSHIHVVVTQKRHLFGSRAFV